MLGISRNALGMTDIEVTAFRQQAGKTGPDLHLRRLVEIDDDVATEDDVEIALEWPLRHPVHFVEGNQALDAIVDLELATPLYLDLLEPLLAHGRRHGFQRALVIGAGAGKTKDLRIDIRCQDAEIIVRSVRHQRQDSE